MSPLLDQPLTGASFVVAVADEGLKADIDRELRENPDLLMDMAAGLDESSEQASTPASPSAESTRDAA